LLKAAKQALSRHRRQFQQQLNWCILRGRELHLPGNEVCLLRSTSGSGTNGNCHVHYAKDTQTADGGGAMEQK
jgi:hypothetical protein